MQVALIIGIMGACRRDELYQLKFQEVKDIESAIVITIPTTKTKTARTFTITGKFAKFCREYMMLRPKNCKSPYFFLNYVDGKCTNQRVGVNKLGSLGKTIASYLKLPYPELYTGHCFRRSSATLLVDAGGDLTDLKRHGGWKSTSVAESYIDESVENKLKISKTIMQSIETNQFNEINVAIPPPYPSTSSGQGTLPINFNNCTIENVHIHHHKP